MQNGNVNVNVAAGQTDSVLLAAAPGKRIVVTAVAAVGGGIATNLTFNSKPAGGGTAISPLLALAPSLPLVLPENQTGWWETKSGEGLTCTTGTGSATGISVTYRVQ